MTNVHHLTLRQADQARTDFAIIEDHLEAIHARLARVPTRVEIARADAGGDRAHRACDHRRRGGAGYPVVRGVLAARVVRSGCPTGERFLTMSMVSLNHRKFS